MPQLDRFSLTLDAGESVVVLGEAGSGKEALIRVLGGFAEKSDQISGTIRFGNAEARPAAQTRARAHPHRLSAEPASAAIRAACRRVGAIEPGGGAKAGLAAGQRARGTAPRP